MASQALHDKLLALSERHPHDYAEVACSFSEIKRQFKKAKPWKLANYHKELISSYHWLKLNSGDDVCDALMLEVDALHASRHRASSAIEALFELFKA